MCGNARAVVLAEFHNVDSIQVLDNDLPDLADEMVEIQVEYCGINFADVYTLHNMSGKKLPIILGIESAGTISKVGSRAPFRVGDRVVCYDYHGSLQQTVLRVHNTKCFTIPANCNLETAAAAFVNYLTAWFVIYSAGNVKEGDTVFVSSCAGGVGLAIVELLNTFKAVSIYGSASIEKRSALESRGVHFVEYEELSDLCPKFDLVVESTSTADRILLAKRLNPFGRIVIIGAKGLIPSSAPSTSTPDPKIDPVDLIYNNYQIGGLHLGMIADNHPVMVQDALLKIFQIIQPENMNIEIVPFEDAKLAYKKFTERKTIGKLLLKV